MDSFWINVIFNICIGLAVIIGFYIFLKKRTDLLDENGALRELIKELKENKKQKTKPQSNNKNVKNSKSTTRKNNK